MRDVEQQRGLADARLAGEQHNRSRDKAATEHPIEFGDAGGTGVRYVRVEFGDGPGRLLHWAGLDGLGAGR